MAAVIEGPDRFPTIARLVAIRDRFKACRSWKEYEAAQDEYAAIEDGYKRKAREHMARVNAHNDPMREVEDALRDLLDLTVGLPLSLFFAVADMVAGVIQESDSKAAEALIDALKTMTEEIGKEGVEKTLQSKAVERARAKAQLELRQALQRLTGRSANHARKILRRLRGAVKGAARVASIPVNVALYLLNAGAVAHDEYSLISSIDKAQQEAVGRLVNYDLFSGAARPAFAPRPGAGGVQVRRLR